MKKSTTIKLLLGVSIFVNITLGCILKQYVEDTSKKIIMIETYHKLNMDSKDRELESADRQIKMLKDVLFKK